MAANGLYLHTGPINKINPHIPTKTDWYHDAINHEIGYITQALIQFMISMSNEKYGEISLSFTQHFNHLWEEVKDKDCCIYVKVILTSRLYALYVLLPKWTKTHIIPLLTWKEDRDNDDTEQFWHSYLSYGLYMSKQLSKDIKKDLLKCLKQINPSYTTARSNLVYLLMKLYLNKQVKLEDFMPNLQKEDRKAPLEWLYLKLEISQDKKIIKKDYALLKKIIKQLVVFPLAEEVSYWIIRCLFSIPYTLYINDWDKVLSKDIGCVSHDWYINDITTKILDIEEGFTAYNLWTNPVFLLKILAKVLHYEKNLLPVTNKYSMLNLEKILFKIKQMDSKLEDNLDYIKLMNILIKTK